MKRTSLILTGFLLSVAIVLTGVVFIGSTEKQKNGQTNDTVENVKDVPGIPFAWPFKSLREFQPRGGATRGSEVTLADEPSDRWNALQENELSKKERDRRAILALAGSYRVSFQFTETMGFEEDYEPAKPYFSWATEHVRVLENQEDLIRLQHITVMYFQEKDGSISGPHPMKHWREDWSYEDDSMFVYQGNRTWKRQTVDPEKTEGRWTQTVYQVDDAPRYEAVGKWKHHDRFSIWKSDSFKRPLPRREFSVRDDYDLLEGTKTITITPNGWVNEQTNAKVRLTKNETDQPEERTIAREIGINRYERITSPNLSDPASTYWDQTGPFWKVVREEWSKALRNRDKIQLGKSVNGKKLYEHLFQRARKRRMSDDEFDAKEARAFVSDLLSKYIDSKRNNDSTSY